MKVNIITVCVGRWDRFLINCSSWKRLSDLADCELFTVTNSVDKVWRAPKGNTIKINNEKFNISKSRNVGAVESMKMRPCDAFFFVDVDITVVRQNTLSPFFEGDFDFATAKAMNHYNGTTICKVEPFMKIRGYDQRVKGWGGEDGNLYERLRKIGAKEYRFTTEGLFHIPHSIQKRVEFYDSKNIGESLKVQTKFQQSHFDLNGESWKNEFGIGEIETYGSIRSREDNLVV